MAQVNQRLKVVEGLLLDLIRKKHDQFLSKRKNYESEYSYDTQSTWHSEFDPEKYLDDVPEAELPSKPLKNLREGENSNSCNTVRTFLSRNAASQALEQKVFGQQLFERL